MDVTLLDLAKKIGISESTLSLYERGKMTVPADVLLRWDAALGQIEDAARKAIVKFAENL